MCEDNLFFVFGCFISLFQYSLFTVSIENTGVYGKFTAPFLSCLANKLVDMSGGPRERQWLHQCLSLAEVRGSAASILACVQVCHPQCINQCGCPPVVSLQWIAIAFRIFAFSVSFTVFRMFCTFCKTTMQYCFALAFLAIPTTAWPMMETQLCDTTHFAWNSWGRTYLNKNYCVLWKATTEHRNVRDILTLTSLLTFYNPELWSDISGHENGVV